MPLAKITDLDRLEQLYAMGARNFICNDDGDVFAAVSADISTIDILAALTEFSWENDSVKFPRMHPLDAYESIYQLRERRGIYDRPPLVTP